MVSVCWWSLAVVLVASQHVLGFSPPPPTATLVTFDRSDAALAVVVGTRRSRLGASSSSSSSSSESGDAEEEIDLFKYYTNSTSAEEPSSSSPLYHDTADSATVKRKSKQKKGNSQYKVVDNRDNLPFVVKLRTPDPYTRPEFKKETARKNTEEDRRRRKRTPGSNAANGIPASIYLTNEMTGDLGQILGEFQLDKSTTSGDVVEVGDRTYQVQTARCQYKYAGGKKFVMVRKILEVKELKRVQDESIIERQLAKTPVEEENPLELE